MSLCYGVFENKNNKVSHWEQPEILTIPARWLNFWPLHSSVQLFSDWWDHDLKLHVQCDLDDGWLRLPPYPADTCLVLLLIISKNKCWEPVTESSPRWGHWSLSCSFSFCFNGFKTAFVRKNQEMFFSKPHRELRSTLKNYFIV